MQHALRPYATAAGVAIVGASLIAATPVVAPLPDVQMPDVALTSALGDALAPWIAQYNTAAENATILANNHALAPAVGLQQAIANLNGYAQEVLNDPSKITAVTEQIQQNLSDVNSGFSLLNASTSLAGTATLHTLDGPEGTSPIGHFGLFGLLPGFLPSSIDPATGQALINFIASPLSGVIMGALGPGLSPLVALANSISDHDSLNATLANMTGAYFNGADLNLDSILPLIAKTGLLPAGTTISHLDLALGGLLSTGHVIQAPYELFNSSGTEVGNPIPAVGGSILNSLGLSLQTAILPGFTLNIASHGIGPIGAWEAWSQTVAGILDGGAGNTAWAWNGKSGGTPPPAVAPLTGLQIPTIPTDYFNQLDDGGASNSASALDLTGLFDGLGLNL